MRRYEKRSEERKKRKAEEQKRREDEKAQKYQMQGSFVDPRRQKKPRSGRLMPLPKPKPLPRKQKARKMLIGTKRKTKR